MKFGIISEKPRTRPTNIATQKYTKPDIAKCCFFGTTF